MVPLTEIVKLVNIGTLFAFVLVNVGVIVLRRTRPEMPRPFKVPLSPVLPILGIAFAVFLMTDLPLSTWVRFVIWLAVGIVIYLLYGYSHSRLRHHYRDVPDLPDIEPDAEAPERRPRKLGRAARWPAALSSGTTAPRPARTRSRSG